METAEPDVHSAGAARELSRGTSTPFQHIFTPRRGVFCAAAGNPRLPILPPGLEVRHQEGMKMILGYLPAHPSLFCSAGLRSEVRSGLEGRPGRGSTKGAPEAKGVGSPPTPGKRCPKSPGTLPALPHPLLLVLSSRKYLLMHLKAPHNGSSKHYY